MAKKPPMKRTTPISKTKPPANTILPPDYIRGSKTVGGEYTAWETAGRGKPDFGKSKGPGDPYREVKKKVKKPFPIPPSGAKPDSGYGRNLPMQRATLPKKDLRINAIKRRLGAL